MNLNQINHLQTNSYNYIGQELIKNINQNVKEDGKIFEKIGNNLEVAKKSYFDALASGDQAGIAKAQDRYQTLTVAMQSALEFLNSKFQIMMSIINKLNLR